MSYACAGGIAIINALGNKNTVLTKLDLANNAIGNKTASAIGDMLLTNRVLRDLDLSWNAIKVGSPA